MKSSIKNLKVQTKLNLVGALIILFAAVSLFFGMYGMNQIRSESVTYLEQEMQKDAADDSKAGIAKIKEEMKKATTHNNIVFALACFIFLLIAIFILALVKASIAESLNSVETALEKISKGDFSSQADREILGQKEEFGNLAGLIEQTRRNVSALVGDVKADASDISQAVAGIYMHTDGLSQEFSDISATAEEMAASMEETANASDEMTFLAKKIQMSVKNMKVQIQNGVEAINTVYAHAAGEQQETLEKWELVRQNQEEIKESLRQALEAVKVMEQVSGLVESVMEITEKTNLLSLNASIEAARAGQAGKGFAVVANEIHKLAEQSRKNVENIQWVTGEAAFAVEKLKNDAKSLLDFVNEEVSGGFGFFENMAEAYHNDAENVSSLILDCKTNAEELSASVSNIALFIEKINNAKEHGKEKAADIADKTKTAAARTNSIAKNSKDAENAVQLLNQGTGHFMIADVEK